MTSLTDDIIDIAMRPADQVPDLPLDFARLSLLDWMTCGIAGTSEPLGSIFVNWPRAKGGNPWPRF